MDFDTQLKNKFLFLLGSPHIGSTVLAKIIARSNNVSINNTEYPMEGVFLPEAKNFVKEYHDVMSEILTCSAFLLHEPLRKRWINEGEEFYNFENNVVYDTDYNTTWERLEWLDEIEAMFKEIGINHSVYNRGVLKENLDNSNVSKPKKKENVPNLI